MRETGLDPIGHVVSDRKRDGTRWRYGGMVRESCSFFRQGIDQFGRVFGDALHVSAVTRMQHLSRHAITQFIAIRLHFRTAAQHFTGHLELLVHDRRGTFFPA